MKSVKLGGLLLLLLCLTPQVHADVTVLLEEPYSYDGAFAGTGHTAIYLTRVCAASPTLLRRCNPGELGVVISRYNRIGQYDWIAVPLLPYLYAVAEPEDIPLYADSKLVAFLRDQYRREYLEDLAPDKPSGETPDSLLGFKFFFWGDRPFSFCKLMRPPRNSAQKRVHTDSRRGDRV